MTFIFRNRTIFWDISKWNRGQKKWDGGSNNIIIIWTREPSPHIPKAQPDV